MRRFYIAIAVAAIASTAVPVSAMSPGECAQLQKRINAARSNARTGGYQMDPGYQTARAAEAAARDQMVATGCNKRVNANKPECIMIITRVNEATAYRKAMESEFQQARQVGASAEEAALVAQYSQECSKTQVRVRQTPADIASDLAPVGVIIGMGLTGGLVAPGLRGRGPSGPGPTRQHPGR